MNDEDFKVRSLFELWSNSLNSLESNVRGLGLESENYQGELLVRQYSKDGVEIRSYRIVGAFPTDVSAIDLNWSSTNAVETFTATFAYDYWIPELESGGVNRYGAAV
jgi:hypothetical protein